MARVIFDHVWKRFGDTVAVRDLSLELPDGEFVVLVGPSGSGKSTAMRMVAGLDEISDGLVVIGDRVVNDLTPKERDVAMVFQSYALYPHMNVHDNLAYALKLRRFSKDDIERRVREAARVLDIEYLLERKPKELSGGQRQRVALGRAIVREPQVFLMDEPLSNLDAKLRVQTRAEIIKLHRRLGVTTIYVTHDQVEAMTMGDRIAVMRGGKLQQVGVPKDVYDVPANTFVATFLGNPPMNLVHGRIARRDAGWVFVGDGYETVLDPQAMALSDEQLAGVEDHPVTFGVRPEHLLLLPPGEQGIPGRIRFLEHVGSDLFVTVEGERFDVQVRMPPATQARQAEAVTLGFTPGQAHLFDEAGRNLRFGAAGAPAAPVEVEVS
jgi:multiple sugar transport system ATP-binding protein